ncbi:DUF6384 family protein [Pseudomonas mosselii]|uniref:DUF6384 family protein n=1 Tax=Pseudomonas mosselii TaxID=78327 RepID=UPI0021DABB14|nr:DUF6384 family protein [Pseudomonas mosselii]MCU9529625.1 DUF6384 family protein [Pseudomonas mosselii]MCU9537766.1 DUF6384 family protein [Pseudomonas mosselii]MCU9544436.1 DUF6384 family protein [Pseudomonas mosselii]MCU9549579.1 DUF6384 family protein [Pseudomonas mosselii]
MSIPLSERIGAMGLVDQLRHREMAIQEHLDLPRRRAEVAEGIRTYYQSHGIAFDEATVEAYVNSSHDALNSKPLHWASHNVC